MKLNRIINNLSSKKIYNYKNINIESITHKSEDVISGSIFIAITGNNYDGNDYIDDAILKGATCVITEKDICLENIVVIVVDNIRIAMSVVAKNFYNKCSDKLNIVGIIGTSGKTTTSLLIAQIMSYNDNKIGVIGTNGIFIGNIRLDNNFTTPDPLELHYVFYQMKMLGVKTVIMEVSAQAIYLNKMYGIKLKIGVFTNITKEHLDFFGSMEDYVRCKMNYFKSINMNECVINIDDFYGMELAYKLDIPCISYGINSPANSFAININESLEGVNFVANILDDVIDVNTHFVGTYNVYNILAALTVAKMLKVPHKQLLNSINNLNSIDGRFNIFKYKNAKIIIDFAHTPDSIDKLLYTIKKYSNSHIISLFGCVGYSDKEKRLDMAKAVAKYSDYVIVTTDNRGEVKFEDIAKDIEIGLEDSQYICIEDRKSAINFGIGMLNSDDILVIMGKGAETFQKIGKEKISYSDIDVVNELINKEM